MAPCLDLSPVQIAFQKSYYPPQGTPWPPLQYHGVPCSKIATDLWRLGELVWALRPGLIIETGTAAGGTALFLADQLAALGHGLVYTIDVQRTGFFKHPHLQWAHGASTLARIVARATELAGMAVARHLPVCVILDSAHDARTVSAELAAYAPLVTPGAALIVEDTNLGDTVMPAHGPGPRVALDAFLAAHPGEWAVATEWEPQITTNPGGYLRRLGE